MFKNKDLTQEPRHIFYSFDFMGVFIAGNTFAIKAIKPIPKKKAITVTQEPRDSPSSAIRSELKRRFLGECYVGIAI